MSNSPTRPTQNTRDAEAREAKAEHEADREPTPEEAEIADALEPDADVTEHEREMAERGAHQKGEGRLP
jgi:hypothetical protein